MRRTRSLLIAVLGASCLNNPEKTTPTLTPTSEPATKSAKVTPPPPPVTAPVTKKEFDPANPCANVDQTPAPSGPEAEAKLQKLSEELLPIVEKSRVIKAGKPVKMAWTSRIEVCQYATSEMEKQTSAEEMTGQETSAKVWGLIPEEMNVKNTMLALFTEQAAGFYDPRKKTLYVADWLPDMIQKPALAHEMYHGVQDQTLDLATVLFEAKNDDTKSSRSALFEGDGTLVMTLAAVPGVDPKLILPKMSAMLPMMRTQVQAGSATMPLFAAAPKSMQESLLFPYLYGLDFVIYGANKTGDFTAVDGAYQKLPESTEQILHPEKFFTKRDDPSVVTLPEKLSTPEGWKMVYENTSGEFALRLVVGKSDPISKEAEAGIGWDGDTFRAYLNEKGQRALVSTFAWDDEKGAKAFAAALTATFPDAFVSSDKKTVYLVKGFGADNEKIAKELSATKIEWK